VDQIEDFTLESFVENKMGEELANLEVNYAGRLTGLESADQSITAQLDQTESKKVDKDGSGQVQYSNLAQDVREKFTGGSVAVVGDNSVVTSNLTDNVVKTSKIGRKEVTPKNTTFITSSSNLFNREDVNIGVISPSGIVDEGRADYLYSHRIDVIPGDSIFTRYVTSLAWFNQNDEFVSRVSATSLNMSFSEVPNNAYYVRANIDRGLYNNREREIQISVGTSEIPYAPFHQKLKDVKVGSESLEPESVSTANITQGAVTPEKTSFIETGINLLDRSKESNSTLISADGTVAVDNSYATSDFISVSPASDLSTRGIYTLSWYDEYKRFIKRDGAIDLADGKFKALSNAHYMRASYRVNTTYRESLQINFGTTLLPYEAYYLMLKGQTQSTETTELENDSVTLEKFALANITSNNLMNEHIAHLNTTVDVVTGELVPNDKIHTSHLVSVKPNTMYRMNSSTHGVAYYDKSKSYIKRESIDLATNPLENQSITTPDNVHYLRVIYANHLYWWDGIRQINEGDVLKPYDQYHSTFTEESGLSKLNRIITEDMMNRNDSYTMDVPIDGVFQTDNTFPDYTDPENLKHTTHTDIYAMYDQLMTNYPDYITSEIIGHDSLGNEIKMYRFIPKQPPADKETKMAKIFLTTGTHGGEKATVPSTYHMFKMMCEEWKAYPLLEALRFNVEWVYIPVVNPSGWNARIRTNISGVDINRNFPEQWVISTEGTNTYSGTHPLSELEAQAVDSIFQAEEDIDIFCDFHNFGPETIPVEDGVFAGEGGFIWVLTDDISYVQHMAQNLISRLSRRWEDDFEWYRAGVVAGYTSKRNGGPGLMENYAQTFDHIKFSSTLEICNTWAINPNGVGNGQDVIKGGVEAVTNWFLIQLKELIK
ncbi:M14 family metallopeptidase, partial [Jeotgalibaca porci]|uniref:M14 family metallopeptidase n=1 Tax=Jeotgalibaca porci TaxID=1868793 RepID=UPI0035A09719